MASATSPVNTYSMFTTLSSRETARHLHGAPAIRARCGRYRQSTRSTTGQGLGRHHRKQLVHVLLRFPLAAVARVGKGNQRREG